MSDIIKPVSPQEIMDNLNTIIPPVVIEAVNNLLKKSYRGSQVSLKQKDIEAEILRLDSTKTKQVLLDNKWLDFESIFSDHGWEVKYDSPSYGDNYFDSFFSFNPKK